MLRASRENEIPDCIDNAPTGGGLYRYFIWPQVPYSSSQLLHTPRGYLRLWMWYAGSPPDSVMVSGRWMYRSTLYEDTLMRVRVDGEDLPARWDLVWVQVPCLAGVAERHA